LRGRINRCGRDTGPKLFSAEKVAYTNKLELLKWIREEKECEWDEWTIRAAAEQGNLEMVKYCVANECPLNLWACQFAARIGHLECLKYLREEAKAPWDSSVLHFAHGINTSSVYATPSKRNVRDGQITQKD